MIISRYMFALHYLDIHFNENSNFHTKTYIFQNHHLNVTLLFPKLSFWGDYFKIDKLNEHLISWTLYKYNYLCMFCTIWKISTFISNENSNVFTQNWLFHMTLFQSNHFKSYITISNNTISNSWTKHKQIFKESSKVFKF